VGTSQGEGGCQLKLWRQKAQRILAEEAAMSVNRESIGLSMPPNNGEGAPKGGFAPDSTS